MRLAKPLTLVLCALLTVVCGCGTEEPDARQDTAEPDVDQSTAGNQAGPGGSEETTGDEAEPLEGFTNSIGMKFKLIPAGEFMMGSPEDEEDRDDDEGPVHRVRITKPYYLGVYEAAQGQCEEVMGARPWEGWGHTKSSPDHAVSYISWRDAVVFCQMLSTRRRAGVSFADGGGMGIRMSRGQLEPVLLW